jgi:hypothetical protein
LANHRLRATAAVIAAVIVLAISAAPAAAQTPIRVENSKATLFQGSVTPVTGTLKDNTGASHTTSKSTALGALLAAARGTNPFTLDLGWFDGLGGGWAGFFLAGVNGTTPPSNAYWALKVNQKVTSLGLGSQTVGDKANVLVYYTTTDPVTFATEPTLGIGTNASTVAAGARVTITVSQYDDAGNKSAAAGAWILVNGTQRVQTGMTGVATVRLAKPGQFRIKATKAGTIRSRKLWITATSSS